MNDNNYEKELKTALRAVAEASRLCEAVGREASSGTIEKTDKSPVTIADFGAQALIMKTLSESFPTAQVVSEEDSGMLKEPENAGLLSRLTEHVNRIKPNTSSPDILKLIDWGKSESNPSCFWTLDPIDGTKGFLRGDQYAISLCLIVEGRLKAAALGCPRLKNTGPNRNSTGAVFGAVEGKGAFELPLDLSGEYLPIKVSRVSDKAGIRMTESVEAAHSSHGDSARIAEYLGITAAPFRIDSQCKYAAVAKGDGDAYLRIPRDNVYREKIWDHAGGALVVTEAGGKITDIKGRPLDFTQGSSLKNNLGVIVTNGLVHDFVLQAVEALKIGFF